jgi:hypothetical protein
MRPAHRTKRIRQIAASALAASSVVLAASHASATEQDIFNGEVQSKKSPQHFALEIRISPFSPDIDKESSLGGKTPYKDTFGTMKRALVGFEFDYQAIRIPGVGTLGPGFSASYTQMTDHSFRVDGTRSAENTDLTLYPMYLAAVLRADVLFRRYKIPVVPYGKAGVGLTFWEISNPGGTAATSDASGNVVKGKGHTWGTQWALGLAIALDALDPGASRNMDNAVGINSTYIYGEYYLAAMNGIAQSHPLLVGTNTWAAGLAFEF